MHKVALILLSLMLIVAPVSAQGASSPDALDHLLQFIRDVGAPWSLILLFVFVVYRLGKPGADAFVENSRARTESEKATRTALETSGKAQSDSAAALKQVAEAMVDLANVNNLTMERMAEFEKRTDAAAARQETAKSINDHTDKAVEPLDGKLQTVAKTLEDLKEKVVTKQAFNEKIDSLVERIDAALQVIHDLQQPQPSPAPTPPVEGAPVDRGSMGEVEKE